MLKDTQLKYLRGLGHKLRPVVTVGDKGLSDSVLAEYETALAHHELIKVKLRVGDRDLRDEYVDELCATAGAELVQRIGNVALVYRENPERRTIRIPSA